MRGKKFDARGLDLAVSNLAGHSRRPLHWAPTREQVSPGRPGHAPSGSFMEKSEVNVSARERARRAAAASTASGKHEPVPTTDYRREAEAIVGRNHAHTEQLRKLFVTEGGKIDWEATLAGRRRAAGL